MSTHLHNEADLIKQGICPTDTRPCNREDLRKCGRCDAPKLSRPLTTVLPSPRSSWIHAVTYLPRVDTPGKGFLVIFTKNANDDHQQGTGNGNHNGTETAIAYVDVPSWLKGLLLAGQTKKGSGRLRAEYETRSIGRAYHQLVKGKFKGQTFTSPENVTELKKLFGLEEGS